MSQPSSMKRRLTTRPAGPVWIVTSVLPSICSANVFTSSIDLARRTPPLSPALGLLELALAAAAGVDLRLHHPDRAGQRLRGRHRLVGREGRRALRHRHAVLTQQLLGLVLVDVHRSRSGFVAGQTALREAIISISTLAPIGSAATAMVERAG